VADQTKDRDDRELTFAASPNSWSAIGIIIRLCCAIPGRPLYQKHAPLKPKLRFQTEIR
jgi:hypothetical protein